MPVAVGYNTRWRRNRPPGQVHLPLATTPTPRIAKTTRDDTDMKRHTLYHPRHAKHNTPNYYIFFRTIPNETYPIHVPNLLFRRKNT